jgi:hypothetical protein
MCGAVPILELHHGASMALAAVRGRGTRYGCGHQGPAGSARAPLPWAAPRGRRGQQHRPQPTRRLLRVRGATPCLSRLGLRLCPSGRHITLRDTRILWAVLPLALSSCFFCLIII